MVSDAPFADAPSDAGAASDAVVACVSCASDACTNGGCDPAVFVTSKEYTGKIGNGGVAAADQECAALAAAAGVPGTFQAWLSGAGALPPATRFANKSSRPYRMLDGRPVAAHFEALTIDLEHSISVTEKRADIGFSFVWTATNKYGTEAVGGGDCAGWTSDDPTAKGWAGESDDFNYEWTAFGDIACSKLARLYCFEQRP